MAPKKNYHRKNNYQSSDPAYTSNMEKTVEILTLRAMTAGNQGDFKTAFVNMEVALWLAQNLEKKCLEAVLLNNMGLLYTLKGAWDSAMIFFDCAMEIAIVSCPPDDNFLTTLKENIACLFDPKIATPGDPKHS